MPRPLIGIPTQTLQAIDGIPTGLPHSWVMNSRYYVAVASVGGAPVMLPLLADDEDALRAVYERVDGLLLAGGVDMDPCSFGEPPHPRLGRSDAMRDAVELTLTRWGLDDRKPVLGLCRGLQVLNVALGGSLHQDIETELPTALKHDYFPTAGWPRDHLAHDVALTPGSRVHHAFEAERVPVNSMHHQAVKRLAPSLHPSAVAPDGVVEAVEGAGDQYVVGVQWHPEMFAATDPGTRRLFTDFVAAARRFAG